MTAGLGRVAVLALALAAEPPAATFAPPVPLAADAARRPFACPEGTVQRGAAPPEGFEQYCEVPAPDGKARREGPERTFYDGGGLAQERWWAGGRLEGPLRAWHRGGLPARAGQYRAGEPEGDWWLWYEGGRVAEVCGFAAGHRHGRFETWWPDGRPRVRGRYCHDVQCGPWSSWDAEGHPLGTVQFEELKGTP